MKKLKWSFKTHRRMKAHAQSKQVIFCVSVLKTRLVLSSGVGVRNMQILQLDVQINCSRARSIWFVNISAPVNRAWITISTSKGR